MFHCKSETDVVRVAWIGPPVPISEEIVWANCIVVGPVRRSCDRDRHLHKGWFEDSLGTNYVYAFPSKFKTPTKNASRNGISVKRNLHVEPLKNGHSNSRVKIMVKTQFKLPNVSKSSYVSIHSLLAIHPWEAAIDNLVF